MASEPKRKRSPSNDATPFECELKLECDRRDIGRLLHHAAIADASPLPGSSGVLAATYFDTPDQALRRAGISLRIRKHHGRFIQTIKAEQGPRGIALNRGEWETEVDGETLDAVAAQKTPLGALLDDEAIRNRIQPVFTVRTRRHAFLIERDNSTIELVLDRTTLRANGRSGQVTEVELELKAGDIRALFLAAKDLSRITPLRLSVLAKSDRGYRLLERAPPKPVKSSNVKVAAGTPSLDAFQMIARETLSRIVQNEELLRSFGDAEALHQMRVGLRRMRTAVSLFKTMLAGRETRAIRRELRRYARLLGPARDLDVLHQTLQENDASEAPLPDLDEVAERRECAYATLAQELDKPRSKSALLRTAIWIEAGDWLSAPSAKALRTRVRPVEKLAKKALARRWKRVRRDAKHIETLSTAKRHAFRMRIKALRYSAEFFADTFEGHAAFRRRESLLKRLEQLQEILGEMNDIATRQRVFPSETSFQPDEIAARISRLMPDATGAARRLRSTTPFWE